MYEDIVLDGTGECVAIANGDAQDARSESRRCHCPRQEPDSGGSPRVLEYEATVRPSDE